MSQYLFISIVAFCQRISPHYSRVQSSSIKSGGTDCSGLPSASSKPSNRPATASAATAAPPAVNAGEVAFKDYVLAPDVVYEPPSTSADSLSCQNTDEGEGITDFLDSAW